MTPAERDEMETLREENRQLRALLLPEAVFPTHCRPRPLEQKIALEIRAASPGAVSRERLWMALYGDRADGGPVSPWVVDVSIGRVRRRLGAEGIEILTLTRRGWYMDATSAARFDELCRGAVQGVDTAEDRDRLTGDQVMEGTTDVD